ncbi:MAG: hypothetical protein SPJ42_05790 [Oscillospiraceae bacterium]|nr:hypothetical protein [Clostridiaceae bacterium]MDO4495961.1 hypothetical protein [Clostridiaceae bacterium]MDY5948733.1 hypothetical protein [Oscillospiraceae bacterium]
MENYIKAAAYKLGADVCGIGIIDRFKNAPAGFSPLDLFDSGTAALPTEYLRKNRTGL